jgi:hypothetical protein
MLLVGIFRAAANLDCDKPVLARISLIVMVLSSFQVVGRFPGPGWWLSVLSSLRGKLEVVDGVLQVSAVVTLIHEGNDVVAGDTVKSKLNNQFLDFGLGFFVSLHFVYLRDVVCSLWS